MDYGKASSFRISRTLGSGCVGSGLRGVANLIPGVRAVSADR